MEQNKSTASSSQLMELFEDELKDIYWAEKALVKAMPKMIEKASSKDLNIALTNHLEETQNHVYRLEQVFQSIDKKAEAVKCDAMEGLLMEAEEKMDSCEDGAMCDAGIIAATQKVEHNEIASYGTLRQFADTLGFRQAATLLEATLKEEKAADQKLTVVAMDTINLEAAQVEA